MKGRLWKVGLMAMVVAGFVTPAWVMADVFMKEKIHTDSVTIMGQVQPPQDRIGTTWITQDKVRTDQGDISIIATLLDGKLMMYHLNHAKKTYTEMMVGSDGAKGPAAAMFGEAKVRVTPTAETKKIGNWNCRKYLQEMDMGMMPIYSEVWASEEIKMPYTDFYEKLSATMAADQPLMGVASQAMMEEIKKIKGMPVLTIKNMAIIQNVNVKTSKELLEIKEGTAPAGTFDIPAGYTKQASVQDFKGRRMPGKSKPQQ